MKPIPWYYIFLVGFIAGALVFWKACEKLPKNDLTRNDKAQIVKIDTVTVTKIIRDTVLIEKTVKVPAPVYITKYVEKEPDPLNFELDQLRTYKDSTDLTKDFRLYYNITTRGTLQNLSFSALDTRPSIIKTRTVTNTIDNTISDAKSFRGLYFSVIVGGNKQMFGTLAPSLDYVNEKNIFGFHYNIIEGSYNLKFGRRLF